jgi:hypothetical protein
MTAVDVVLDDRVLQDTDVALPHGVHLVHRHGQVSQIRVCPAKYEILRLEDIKQSFD